ncbi:hypothetical protein TNCV_3771271 [Trichonephila clavipes]|nr:hypothetical protein TNCV_3771271 [Trichonephila clavipes]
MQLTIWFSCHLQVQLKRKKIAHRSNVKSSAKTEHKTMVDRSKGLPETNSELLFTNSEKPSPLSKTRADQLIRKLNQVSVWVLLVVRQVLSPEVGDRSPDKWRQL